jgi:hypothetical protein
VLEEEMKGLQRLGVRGGNERITRVGSFRRK